MQKLGDHSKYCRGRNQVKLKGLFAAFLPASDEFGQIPAWVGKFCAGILAPSFSDGLSEEALQHPAEQQEKSRAHRSSSRLRKGREAACELAALHLQHLAKAAGSRVALYRRQIAEKRALQRRGHHELLASAPKPTIPCHSMRTRLCTGAASLARAARWSWARWSRATRS